MSIFASNIHFLLHIAFNVAKRMIDLDVHDIDLWKNHIHKYRDMPQSDTRIISILNSIYQLDQHSKKMLISCCLVKVNFSLKTLHFLKPIDCCVNIGSIVVFLIYVLITAMKLTKRSKLISCVILLIASKFVLYVMQCKLKNIRLAHLALIETLENNCG